MKKMYDDVDEEDMNEDEGQMLISRLGTLRNISIDMTKEIEKQNKKMSQLDQSFQLSLSRIFATIKSVKNSSPKRFRSWIYFIFGGLLLSLLFFVLFIAI
ncbi:hypothetical protein CWI42_010150 [Ordospora colligata]|uniref:t-SNARE coiled-coil homology domain-containing protein n=1 Tax=Ordospora colligata OC4 TaxID=1354746 RepID=A0A0B2UM76_9MICR|nr:uncharacterized protein M896_010150 [Ordospora colligata OC4]KHN70364.1 hypothetical protein M896_010150 [Ordospora colligata OC4]TBU17364.1 hypothetical protein CWI40_010150 [Ordospora colligata]TBU19544.1 hypothetical protein CWI42_010150 [Ordospora colligata]